MQKSFFITFEGIDGCGKSTQLNLLADFLKTQDFSILKTREPGGTRIGDKIREILLNHTLTEMKALTELLLYCAGRSQHVEEVIRPALQEGKVVLSDRYTDATDAYQGGGRDIDSKILQNLHSIATNNLKPDLTILLDLPSELGLKRIQNRPTDRLEKEALHFYEKVRKSYLELAKKEPKRIQIFDATKSISEIHESIIKIVAATIQKCGLKPLDTKK